MGGREEKILEYIEANPGCTKTMVNNGTDMAENTAKKAVKKLIDEGQVICEIDDVNSRIHHLYINNNNSTMSLTKTKNLILSKVQEQINNQTYTMVQLMNVDNSAPGGWAVMPVNDTITVNLKSAAMQNLSKRAGY
jgi:predicted transcriptional regulator